MQGSTKCYRNCNSQNGNLSSGGNLTLVSTAAQTALIDGSGTGNVTGNVTMQRYLPSGFGYKYFSSPFQSATVNEFTDDMTLGHFTFYRYDENRTSSGWVSYHNPVNKSLNPLRVMLLILAHALRQIQLMLQVLLIMEASQSLFIIITIHIPGF